MNAWHFRVHVVRPVLTHLDLAGPVAEPLLVATALAESDLAQLRSREGGGLGLYGITPGVRRAVHLRLADRPQLARPLADLMTRQPADAQLVENLAYATAIARLVYELADAPLPAAADAATLAEHWRRYYPHARPLEAVERIRAEAPALLDGLAG